MPNSESFFVKSGYIPNEKKIFLKEEVQNYWTEERILSLQNIQYQYYVYTLAAKIAKRKKLLYFMDVGSGPATKAKEIISPLVKEAVLIDQSECKPLVQKLYPEARFITADLEVCDVDFEYLADLLICADVLEHLSNPYPCLKFSYNHLAPSGFAIFSTPERDILRGTDCNVSPHQDHVREWNQSEFKQLLEYSGFTVIEQTFLPAAKLPVFEDLLWKLSPKLIMPTDWKSCQVAICQKTKQSITKNN